MSAPEIFYEGLSFGEGPRWHDGRLWVSDFYTHRVLAIDEAGTAQYGRTLAVGDEGSDFRLRHYKLAPDLDGPALHAGQVELYLEAGARARFAPVQDWGGGRVVDDLLGRCRPRPGLRRRRQAVPRRSALLRG